MTPSLPPGPKGNFLLGSLPELRRDPMGLFRRLREEHGDVSLFRLGRRRCYLLCHPEHVRYVLRENSRNYKKSFFFEKMKVLLGNGLLPMTYEDDFWRTRRRLSQPPFHSRSLREFTATWTIATEDLLERWRPFARSGRPLDAFDEMIAHTLELAARTLLSIDPEHAESERVRNAFAIGLEHLMHKVEALVDWPEWVPTPRNRRFLRARGELDDVIYKLIDERRRAGPDAVPDFLTTLIRACEEDPSKRVDDRQLRDEVMTLFIAGFETNASALAWTLWLLARHPDYDERLRQELKDVLDGRTPGFDDLPRLEHTRMALDESMRLYPPAWWFTREAIADDRIAGYPIPAGSIIVLSQHVTHRHPDFWEEPDRFDPLRFTPERSKSRPPLAYFPFGEGPRSCIGRHFAMLQMQLVVAMIAQRYRIRDEPGHEVELWPVITLRPRNGVPIRIEEVAEQPAHASPAPGVR